jgi:hypothetical protein
MNLEHYRRFFAEEIEAVAKPQTPGLVEALATVPREQFLRPGPWTVLADNDFMAGTASRTRTTADADPRRVYHNIVVAIDPARQLFNGQPSTRLHCRAGFTRHRAVCRRRAVIQGRAPRVMRLHSYMM